MNGDLSDSVGRHCDRVGVATRPLGADAAEPLHHGDDPITGADGMNRRAHFFNVAEDLHAGNIGERVRSPHGPLARPNLQVLVVYRRFSV